MTCVTIWRVNCCVYRNAKNQAAWAAKLKSCTELAQRVLARWLNREKNAAFNTLRLVPQLGCRRDSLAAPQG